MNAPHPHHGRLSLLAAARVIARRDFIAILWSRSFLFFLLGPLFPAVVGLLAGTVGSQANDSIGPPVIGVMMSRADTAAMLAAEADLAPHLADALPQLVPLGAGAPASPAQVAAMISGTPAHPVLAGPGPAIEAWQGPVALLAARADGHAAIRFAPVRLAPTATSTADTSHARLLTAQAAQTLLLLLTMLLAGMVLSNLVEEKANKIIEILAAAIPMDAVFLGKLVAMLGVSLVGIAVWGAAGALLHLAAGQALPALTAPAVGWPLFVALGIAYFAMGYLLLGSVFLAIGSLASTVREVQTLSMPATMMQILVFFFAGYAIARPGSGAELAAMVFPFSSPFTMVARAALQPALWPHVAALGWQALWVALLVRWGAALFRRRVMKSGPQAAPRRRRWFARG